MPILSMIKIAGAAVAILALVAFVGWIGYLRSTIADQAKTIAVYDSELKRAGEINAENIAALDRLKIEAAKREIALAESIAKTEQRTVAVSKIRQEVARVPVSPTDTLGPHVAAAVGELRKLKTARIADEDPDRKAANPRAASVVPK